MAGGHRAPAVNPGEARVLLTKIAVFLLSTAAAAVAVLPLPVSAQVKAEAPAAPADSAFAALPGRWVRPDGGYVIDIRGVDASGKLAAAYANPNPLPFARAEATRDGKTVHLFFELRATTRQGTSCGACTIRPWRSRSSKSISRVTGKCRARRPGNRLTVRNPRRST